MNTVRILFISDTHLGFDLPINPRIKRRRRGIDFFKNYELALKPAFSKNVDILIHGGDLFYRSKIPELLMNMAFEPLVTIAESGIPVIIVPGNHERSFVRQSFFEKHKNIFIFNNIKSFNLDVRGEKVLMSGFPCVRKNIRYKFKDILNQVEYKYYKSDHIHLLCMHQAVEGAQAGVQNFTFRSNHDTICASDIPGKFAAILSGHIHRKQVIEYSLTGKKMPVNVFYPGSIERTSFAEKKELKCYLVLNAIPTRTGGKIQDYKFVPLPSRPMQEIIIDANCLSKIQIINKIIKKSSTFDKNSIVKLKIKNNHIDNREFIKVDEIRKVLPSSMNLSFKVE